MRAASSTLIIVAVTFAAVPRTRAQPADATQPSAPALAAEGAKLYAATSYLDAADRFDRAYALDKTPSYLFNAAQAYRLANVCDKSAARYEQFLDVAPKDTQGLDKVRGYLEEERACAKDHELASPPPQVPVAVPVAPPVHQPPPPPLPPPAHGDHAWMKWTGIGAAAVGAVAIVYGVHEHSVVGDNTKQRGQCDMGKGPGDTAPCTVVDANQIDIRGARASHHMVEGFSVGAAGLVGGAVLYLLGRDPERASIEPTTGGAVLSTRFTF
jgi:hypothetical protein